MLVVLINSYRLDTCLYLVLYHQDVHKGRVFIMQSMTLY